MGLALVGVIGLTGWMVYRRAVAVASLGQAHDLLAPSSPDPVALGAARRHLDRVARWLPREPAAFRLEALYHHLRADRTRRDRFLRRLTKADPLGWGPYYESWIRVTTPGEDLPDPGRALLPPDPRRVLPRVRLQAGWLQFPALLARGVEGLPSPAPDFERQEPLYHFQRAAVRIRSGELDGALEDLERARELAEGPGRGDPTALVARGGVLRARSTTDPASLEAGDWSPDLVREVDQTRLVLGQVHHLLAMVHRRQGAVARSIPMADFTLKRYLREIEALGLREDLLRELFPVPFQEAILRGSRDRALDPCLVLAVIREETRFDPAGVSGAGAVGLMQLMPDTGRWIASKLGQGDFEVRSLYNPVTNILLGCWYLDHLLQTLGDSEAALPWVLAAYNGGIGNVQKWKKLARERGLPPEDAIEFPETRGYIAKVRESHRTYRRLYPELAALRADRSGRTRTGPVRTAPRPGTNRAGSGPGRRKTPARPGR